MASSGSMCTSLPYSLGLLCLPDTLMTRQEQFGDVLCFSTVVVGFTLEILATIDFHWLEFLSFSMKLNSSYVDWKISPEPLSVSG